MWMTRPMLLLLLVFVAGTCNKETRAAPLPTGGRLRDLAGQFHRDFQIGYASSTGFWSFPDAFDYKQVAAREFNILTPINDMKMETIQPQRDIFNFTRADRHVDFAQAHNMTVCGHTLIWHSQIPDWLTSGKWTSSELLNIMETHITTVVGHWNQGEIVIWHVTNEILEYDGSYRNTIWYKTLNEAFVPAALLAARAADPLSKLILNDYSMESVNAKSDAYYALAQNLQINGIPLDGIGFQAHLTVDEGFDGASFRANMQRFSDLNLEIYITELDVRILDSGNSSQVARQSEIYHQVISACLEQPACKALQTWGFTDKYSWIPDHDPGYGRALIFDENYNAKEPYYELQTALLESQPMPNPSSVLPTGSPMWEPLSSSMPSLDSMSPTSPVSHSPTSSWQPNIFDSTATITPSMPSQLTAPKSSSPESGSRSYPVLTTISNLFVGAMIWCL